MSEPIQYYNRETKTVETEAIYGEPFLRWAYETRLGRLTVAAIAKRHWFSHWYGWRMNRPRSAERIQPFIDAFGLDPSEFEKAPDTFVHFNEFFARKLRPTSRPIDTDPGTVVFPADGRHLVFPNLAATQRVFVKGQRFDLAQIFGSASLATQFEQGSAVLSRLCPTDYHRFHFATDGRPGAPVRLSGHLYSVSPLALRQRLELLWANQRMRTLLEHPVLGTVAIIEFGATNVGSIRQTYEPDQDYRKGAEKGYFLFGGSATMTFFQPGKVRLDSDLIAQSQSGLETYARMGESMGRILSSA